MSENLKYNVGLLYKEEEMNSHKTHSFWGFSFSSVIDLFYCMTIKARKKFAFHVDLLLVGGILQTSESTPVSTLTE